ncbi:MAG: hypothetical protein LBJ46_08455 [Planctomycetota bacterium]|jgi:type II secretory pathway component GspD/PulD (secretin)|nr:hypothetical protein [Planctomycetota bacterium]
MKTYAFGRGGLAAVLAALTLLVTLQGARAESAIEILNQREEGRAFRIARPYRQVRLERVLADLEKLSPGIAYRVKAQTIEEEDELLATPVTMEMAGVNVDTALNYLADRLKLIINRDDAANGVVFFEKVARFTDIFDGVRLGDAINEITRRGSANVVFSPMVDTDARVFLTFTDVPWREALDSVLRAHGCTVLLDGGGKIMRIATTAEADVQFETRSRPLRYVQPEGSHFQPEIVKAEFNDFVGRKGGTGIDVGKSLIQVLEQVKSANGNVTYESRTNTLILRDTPVKIQEMLKLVDEIDTPPQQILIETRMLTVESDPQSKLGVRWGTDDDEGQYAGIGGGVMGGSMWDVTWPWGPNNSGPDLSSGDVVTKGVMDLAGLQFWLQAAQFDKTVNMVQAPQILVLDNEEASVFIGDIRTYATISSTQNETSTSTSITEKEVLVGVQLLVIPHVCRGTDEIILEVIPKQSDDPEFQSITAGTSALRIPDRLPVKMVHTKMMLHSSETGVIAGLFKEETREESRRVPGISKIPVFGKLFNHSANDLRKMNSMILVTPTIIPPRHTEDFDNEIESFRESLAAAMNCR